MKHMNRKTRFNIWYPLFAVFGVLLIHDLWVQTQSVTSLPYSEFLTSVRAVEVEEVVVSKNDVRGVFEEDAVKDPERFVTTRVDRQKQGQDLRRNRHPRVVRRCGRRG